MEPTDTTQNHPETTRNYPKLPRYYPELSETTRNYLKPTQNIPKLAATISTPMETLVLVLRCMKHYAVFISADMISSTLFLNCHASSVIYCVALHRKWSFSVRISSVNVIKNGVSCGFCHIYWRNT